MNIPEDLQFFVCPVYVLSPCPILSSSCKVVSLPIRTLSQHHARLDLGIYNVFLIMYKEKRSDLTHIYIIYTRQSEKNCELFILYENSLKVFNLEEVYFLC